MAKKKSTQKKYFPKDFLNPKIVKKFSKPRSPRTRLFVNIDPDDWFIDVLEIKTKTGEVTDEEGWITRKDMNDWTEWYINLGWEEQKT